MNYTTSPAFTLPLSRKKTIHEMPQQDYSSPGPVYNTWGLGIKHKSSSHAIGNSRRTEINHWVERTPSPAHYQPIKRAKKHAVSIPKADPKLEINATPDPAWYNPELRKVKPKSPVFSIGAKYGSIMDDVNDHPGPGQYQANREMPILSKSKSQRATLFTATTRFASARKSPGVGDYQISSRQLASSRGKIGNGLREPISKPVTPAPTDYNKVSVFDEGVKKNMGKSISAKLKGCFVDNPLTAQSFNKYFEKGQVQLARFRSSQEYTIPNQKREIFPANGLPGPSDYSSHAYEKKNSHKVVIPASTYQPHQEIVENPAPNAYNLQTQRGPKFTIPRAKSATLVRDHPGVGRYNISQGIQTRAGSAVPKSARTNFISKNTAGVGDYKLEQKPSFKGTIGKSQRFKKVETQPGPGDYHIQSILGYKSKHK